MFQKRLFFFDGVLLSVVRDGNAFYYKMGLVCYDSKLSTRFLRVIFVQMH